MKIGGHTFVSSKLEKRNKIIKPAKENSKKNEHHQFKRTFKIFTQQYLYHKLYYVQKRAQHSLFHIYMYMRGNELRNVSEIN